MVGHKAWLVSALKPLTLVSRAVGLSAFTPSPRHPLETFYSLTLAVIAFTLSILTLRGYLEVLSAGGLHWILARILMLISSSLAAILALISSATPRTNLGTTFNALVHVDEILYPYADVYRPTRNIVRASLFAYALTITSLVVFDNVMISDGKHFRGVTRSLVFLISDVCVIQFFNLLLFVRSKFATINQRLNHIANALRARERRFRRAKPVFAMFQSPRLFSRRTEFVPEDLGKVVRSLARCHGELYQVAMSVNDRYGLQMLAKVVSLFVAMLSYLNMTLYLSGLNVAGRLNQSGYTVYYIVSNCAWLCFKATLLVLIASCCHLTAQEANASIVSIQRLLLIDDLPADLGRELVRFSRQLGNGRLAFSACGFFGLDFTLVVSVVGAVTSYVIILQSVQ